MTRPSTDRLTIQEAMELTGLSRITLMRHKDELDPKYENRLVVQNQEVLTFDAARLAEWAASRGRGNS